MVDSPNPFAPTALLVLDPEIGVVTVWQGAIVDIPSGWVLCDGNNGTPDLRNRMVVGSTSTYAQRQSGGVTQHPHDFTADGHTHYYPPGPSIEAGPGYDELLDTRNLTGSTENTANQPPYYSLAYIMFIGD